jgi:catechol 2,3-dioxygenase-like lactoylglutathione lyase family enzyme
VTTRKTGPSPSCGSSPDHDPGPAVDGNHPRAEADDPGAGAHGIGTSVFCRDPDGSLIELISYA